MTERSMSENAWKTKLERISEKAKKEKETVFNNLGHCIDLDKLIDTYRKMDGNKATGIDGVTKEEYGKNLINNLTDLLKRIRTGSYRSKTARIVEIPKEDGSTRPLAISCFEDKIVQSVVSEIISMIFEPIFLPCSYGFRPEHSCHEALKALMKYVYLAEDGGVVEIDIKKYFNTIPHGQLMEMLRKKISDEKFLNLVEKIIKMPVIEKGKKGETTLGCPQGSIISPILANIYLHYVIDEWFAQISKSHMRKQSGMVRYADDMVFVFEEYSDAERFYKVLPKRLNKYGLELKEEKSQILKSGSKAALKAKEGKEKLGTYKFLGFIAYWGKSRVGKWRLKYKSRSDRFTAKLKNLKEYLRKNLNGNTGKVLEKIVPIVRGWLNYHAISDNERRVKSFLFKSRWIVFKWFNRRGGKRGFTWEKLVAALERVGFPSRFKTVSMFS